MNKQELIEHFNNCYNEYRNAPDPYSDEDGLEAYCAGNIDDAFSIGYNLGQREALERAIEKITLLSE